MTAKGAKTRAAVAGGSGLAGYELLRILLNHPRVEIVSTTSERFAGKSVADVYPQLRGRIDLSFTKLDPKGLAKGADVVFLALPHTVSMQVVAPLLEAGRKVVDLSADFRLRDRADYEAWYEEHRAPHLLPRAVYGLPEIHGDEIERAVLVANPGCYPTGAILALAPLLKEGLVDPATIIVDSKSGVSGAGRGLAPGMHFTEVSEGVRAYKVARHRHLPEIEQELSLLAGGSLRVTFTPHLIPMNRGILTTAYATLREPLGAEALLDRYAAFYTDAPFVRVAPPGVFPATQDVRGSNYLDVGLTTDPRTRRVIVVSALDNLVKGASGQAVQNMNRMLGFEETAGLGALPHFP